MRCIGCDAVMQPGKHPIAIGLLTNAMNVNDDEAVASLATNTDP